MQRLTPPTAMLLAMLLAGHSSSTGLKPVPSRSDNNATSPLLGGGFLVSDNRCAGAAGSPVISSRLHTSQTTCCKLCTADPYCKLSWTSSGNDASDSVCYLQAAVQELSSLHLVQLAIPARAMRDWAGSRTGC